MRYTGRRQDTEKPVQIEWAHSNEQPPTKDACEGVEQVVLSLVRAVLFLGRTDLHTLSRAFPRRGLFFGLSAIFSGAIDSLTQLLQGSL